MVRRSSFFFKSRLGISRIESTDEAQVKAEVQEKESRSVQQSMAKLNLGVSRATREGIRKIGRLDQRERR